MGDRETNLRRLVNQFGVHWALSEMETIIREKAEAVMGGPDHDHAFQAGTLDAQATFVRAASRI